MWGRFKVTHTYKHTLSYTLSVLWNDSASQNRYLYLIPHLLFVQHPEIKVVYFPWHPDVWEHMRLLKLLNLLVFPFFSGSAVIIFLYSYPYPFLSIFSSEPTNQMSAFVIHFSLQPSPCPLFSITLLSLSPYNHMSEASLVFSNLCSIIKSALKTLENH